ncbi:MAG: hypothetical protein R3E56_11895 [Burkholderiaceae bacterium]
MVTATGAPPSVMAWPSTWVMVNASPSMSVSLANTSMVTEPSSATVKPSLLATGASLVGVTVPETVAVEVSKPSVTV